MLACAAPAGVLAICRQGVLRLGNPARLAANGAIKECRFDTAPLLRDTLGRAPAGEFAAIGLDINAAGAARHNCRLPRMPQ